MKISIFLAGNGGGSRGGVGSGMQGVSVYKYFSSFIT